MTADKTTICRPGFTSQGLTRRRSLKYTSRPSHYYVPIVFSKAVIIRPGTCMCSMCVNVSWDLPVQTYNCDCGSQLPNGSLMSISRNCFTPSNLPPVVATCNYDHQRAASSGATDEEAVYKPGSHFVWSTSLDGGVSWSRPQIHPDLPSPGATD